MKDKNGNTLKEGDIVRETSGLGIYIVRKSRDGYVFCYLTQEDVEDGNGEDYYIPDFTMKKIGHIDINPDVAQDLEG